MFFGLLNEHNNWLLLITIDYLKTLLKEAHSFISFYTCQTERACYFLIEILWECYTFRSWLKTIVQDSLKLVIML